MRSRVVWMASFCCLHAGATLKAQDSVAGGVEFGRASRQPGQTVDLPVFLTLPAPARAGIVAFTFDTSRLEFLRFVTDSSDVSGADPLSLHYRSFAGTNEGNFGILDDRTQSQSFRIPAGDGIHFGSLRFRLRATAPPGQAVVRPQRNIDATAGGSSFTVDGPNSSYSSVILANYTAGGVEVTEPIGPRPVDALSCAQFLDRVQLGFTATAAYDSIDILRDGVMIAALPGNATSYTDVPAGLNTFHYEVIAKSAGGSSVAADCELTVVSPTAPPVRNVGCTSSGVQWTNPISYDQITVLKNDQAVATLPGTAQSYSDPEPSQALTVYTVIGDLEGFRSPASSCLANGIWIVEIGDVQVPVDARRVEVPIYATTSATVLGFDLYLNLGESRSQFGLIKDFDACLADTVIDPEPEYFQLGLSGAFIGAPATGIIFDNHAPRDKSKDLTAGLRQRIFNFILSVEGTFHDGDAVPVSLFSSSFIGLGPMENGGVSQAVDIFVNGQIRFGTGGPAAVEDLLVQVAAPSPGAGAGGQVASGADVQLSWRNGSPYESVRIERNGGLVAELPGSSSEYRDPSVLNGVYTYKVIGLERGRSSFPTSALLSTFEPAGAFLRGDANRDRIINVADPIRTLAFLFLGGKPLPCNDAADTDDDGFIELTDAIVTLSFLFLGNGVIKAPGVKYPWFDPTPDGLSCD